MYNMIYDFGIGYGKCEIIQYTGCDEEYYRKFLEIKHCIHDNRYFNVSNIKMLDNPLDTIVTAMSIMLSDACYQRKKACFSLLKLLLSTDFIEKMLDDGGIYPIDRNDKKVYKWKKEILSKGECEICGSKEDLEAHHIIGWSDYPKGRIDVKNGMCLCNKCHSMKHKGESSEKLILGRCEYVKQKRTGKN